MTCAWCKSPILAGPRVAAAGRARTAPTSHGMCRACLEVRVRPQGLGFASEGPGFYVWDEDRAEVVRFTRELRGVATPRTGPLAAPAREVVPGASSERRGLRGHGVRGL